MAPTAAIPELGPAGEGARILVVDDDPDILRVVRHALEPVGLDVAACASGEAALAWVERHGPPQLAVVDIGLPGIDGLELCARLHAWCDLPVVMLTAVADEPTTVRAIEEHAEDYVVKPFQPAILAARIRRVLRRFAGGAALASPEVRVDARLALRFQAQTALVDGRTVPLTPTETKLLHVLLRNAPRVVATEHLLARIWPQEEVFEDALRVHVHRLRQKLEPDPRQPRYLVTERGVGYRFGAAP